MLGNMAEEGLQDAWRKAGVLLEENAKIRKNIAKNPDTDDEAGRSLFIAWRKTMDLV